MTYIKSAGQPGWNEKQIPNFLVNNSQIIL